MKYKKYIRSLLHYIYLYPYAKVKKIVNKTKIPPICYTNNSEFGGLKIAYICDEMTWQDYHSLTDSVFVHPLFWKRQLESFKPDILFCESAWTGIDDYKDSWRARLVRDPRVCFDNRRELLEILSYCKQNDIDTIFWNKEDPTFFEDPIYNFVDTACLFDYIFTTAWECITKYKQLGCNKVFVLPFGVNIDMFHSKERIYEPNSVIFVGSWYGNLKERCCIMENMLDHVISKGWLLDIYNRKSDNKRKIFRFPNKYHPYIKPKVPYTEIPQLVKNYEYAINVNTVLDSKTMCSRRLLQTVACGVTVISNDCAALESLSDCLVCIKTEGENIYLKGIESIISEKYCTKILLKGIINIIYGKEIK